MKCIRCGHQTFRSTTSEAIELESGVLVIREIPCHKCETCDEIHLTGDVVKQLEHIVSDAKQRLEEVSIVKFNSAA